MLGNDEEIARELAAQKTVEQIADELNTAHYDATGKVLSRAKVFTWWRVIL